MVIITLNFNSFKIFLNFMILIVDRILRTYNIIFNFLRIEYDIKKLMIKSCISSILTIFDYLS